MRITDTHVYFYGTKDIYSNFHPARFVAEVFHDSFDLGSRVFEFNCSEQLFMAYKALHFDDVETFEEIMKAKLPQTQKALGRKVKGFDEKVWETVRLRYMDLAVIYKFSQVAHLKEQILATGEKTLVEATSNDKIWGIGLDEWDDRILDQNNWQGQNLLGEALMTARYYIKGI